MSKKLSKIIVLIFALLSIEVMAQPVVSILAAGATSIAVPPNTLAAIYYNITNNTPQTLTLNYEPLPGITQSTSGDQVCGQPIVLAPNASCLFTLVANGSNLPSSPVKGLRLYREVRSGKIYSTPPSGQDIYVTSGSSTPELIVVSGDPVVLYQSSSPVTKVLTIQNASTSLTVSSITVSLNPYPNPVIIDKTDCNSGLQPGQTCAINFTPTGTALTSAQQFEVIVSANGNSSAQATASLTLNPVVPITYNSHTYGSNPQIVTFGVNNPLYIRLNNVSGEDQTLSFNPPNYWSQVNISGCTSISSNGTCTLILNSSKANYAGLFTINSTSRSGYTTQVLMPVAFQDISNNLVYSVNPPYYLAIQTTPQNPPPQNPPPQYSPNQWCSSSANPNCNLFVTGATDLNNGFVNTSNITSTFTSVNYLLNTYAAGYCSNLSTSGLSYYLPAVCELGNDLQGAGCATGTDNIYNNLIQYGFLTNFIGPFWSSTANTDSNNIEIPGSAWLQFLYTSYIGFQYTYFTDFNASFACAAQGTY